MNKIRIFSDYAWPFCYVGLGLVQKLKEDGIEFELDWVPFELDPNAPIEGMDLYDVYPKEYIHRSLDNLSRMGKDFGIIYNNKNGKFNTRRAHLGGFYALEEGKYDEYAWAVFKAYFEDGVNVSDAEVLSKIADSIGLDPVQMLNSIDSQKYDEKLKGSKVLAHEYGIQSVPTFIINNKYMISGVRDYDDFKKAIVEIFNRLEDYSSLLIFLDEILFE